MRVLQEQRDTTTEQARQNLKAAMMFDRISLIASIIALAVSIVAIARTIDIAQ